MRTLFLFYLLLVAISASPDDRYTEKLFDSIAKETYTYATKDGEDLDLDIYLPEFDSELERPVVLYVHGGGFRKGTRDRADIQEFCRNLAGYGYIVVSMSYRLTRKDEPSAFGCDCPANDKLNTFQAAVEDIQDATFFLIERRDQLGIDPQKIILAGSSAGAEAVLNSAYTPPNCYGLDSGPVAYAGVIGMAGAIPDTVVIYDESAIPSLLFHGTDDPTVPYGTAPHHYCNKEDAGFLIMHGSYTIARKLNQIEVPCWLHTTCGGAHELASAPMKKYFPEIVEFCHSFVLNDKGEQRHTIIDGGTNSLKFKQFDFCRSK